ncbi:PIG-P-domain-containing protein [Geopyxis carbonaria]|nr:PIG-P-domain-containing protein [Geopyxis carbonaria]
MAPSSLAPPMLDLRRPHSPRRVNSMPSSASNSSSSLPSTPTTLHPLSFAPPFYNRPPTPLPPSPSLTSLLRPSFTPSRPTTPDSSDSEAITHSSHLSLRSPRYAPKVPTYEYYGFMLYIIANFCAILYVAWSFLPDSVLAAMGVTYYPSRWWSLAIPSYLVVSGGYVYVALAALNVTVLTRPLEGLETVVDKGGLVARLVEEKEEDGMSPIAPLDGGEKVDEGEKWTGRREGGWAQLWSRGTDAVMDVPLGGVCEVLYGEGRVWEAWEEYDD